MQKVPELERDLIIKTNIACLDVFHINHWHKTQNKFIDPRFSWVENTTQWALHDQLAAGEVGLVNQTHEAP